MPKKVLNVVLKVVSAAAIIAVVFACFNVKQPETPEDMERELSLYRKHFDRVVDFCRNIDYEKYRSINFQDTDFLYDGKKVYTVFPKEEGNISGIKDITIEDKKLVRSLYKFFRKRYGCIHSDETGIVFQRRANRIRSMGVAYSFGDSVPNIDFLIYSEPLSEDGWYYYYTDFNAYKEMNGQD